MATSYACKRRRYQFTRSGVAERGGIGSTERVATIGFPFRHRAGPVRKTRSQIVEVTP